MKSKSKRVLAAGAVACMAMSPAAAGDVTIPGGVAAGGAAVAGGLMVARGGRFCLRHPALCAAGAIGGLAVGGIVIAAKKREMQKQGLCGPTGEAC